MKTKQLTQAELATLASNLPTGSAKERVRLAYEIWMEADPVRAELAYWKNRINDREEQWQEAMSSIMPFDKALEVLFPDSHPIVRADEFQRFRNWQRDCGGDVPPLEGDRKIGVRYYPAIHAEIEEWRAAERKTRAKEKASNAAKKRWGMPGEEKRRERKAGGKTQQVRKKSKT